MNGEEFFHSSPFTLRFFTACRPRSRPGSGGRPRAGNARRRFPSPRGGSRSVPSRRSGRPRRWRERRSCCGTRPRLCSRVLRTFRERVSLRHRGCPRYPRSPSGPCVESTRSHHSDHRERRQMFPGELQEHQQQRFASAWLSLSFLVRYFVCLTNDSTRWDPRGIRPR